MGEVKTLSDVCEAIVDCAHKTAPTDLEGEYFAVGTPAMRQNVIDYAEARRISRKTFEDWTQRLTPRHGDLLLAREAPVGPVVRIPREENVAPGQRTVLLRPRAGVAHERFLFYYLVSPQCQAAFRVKASGSTVPHLNVADVRNLEVPSFPDFSTQQAIAEVLGALDDKIAANQLVVRLLNSIGESAVVRETSTIPPVELRAVADLSYGKALPVASRSTGNVQVYGSGGVVGSHDTALVDGPGIVIGRKGTVGALYWADGPHFPIDTTYYVVPKPDVSPYILYYALRAVRLSELNSDSAVPGLNRDEAYGQYLRVPLGSDAEQLARRLERDFELAKSLREQTRCLAQTRDKLLPLLMSGKVTVKDIEPDIV